MGTARIKKDELMMLRALSLRSSTHYHNYLVYLLTKHGCSLETHQITAEGFIVNYNANISRR